MFRFDIGGLQVLEKFSRELLLMRLCNYGVHGFARYVCCIRFFDSICVCYLLG